MLRDDDDRQAWHLAAAAIGPDEEVAAALERACGLAAACWAYAAGSGALERAARLSPDPEVVGRRLITAGEAATAAGVADRALALFAEAAELACGEEQRARAQQLRGRLQVWRGRPAEATPVLVVQAHRVASRWPVLAAEMLAHAANGATTINSYFEAERLAQRAVGLLGDEGDPAVRGAVLTMRGWTLLLRGKAPEARPVLARGLPSRRWPGQARPGLAVGAHPAQDAHPARGVRAGAGRERRTVPRAQEAGALATMSAAGLPVADAAFRLGDWEAADAAALQTFQLAEDVGHRHMAGWALTIRTRILAAQGRCEESRAAAATALAIAESDRISTGLRFVHGALGFLELGLDRIDAAMCELEAVERLTQGSGHEEPVIVPWIPDLVEAYARQGREYDARRALARLERQAVCSASPVAAAAAARCRGMLDDDFEPAFAGALAFDDVAPCRSSGPGPCWLSADGRGPPAAAAGQHPPAALEGFERLHADAWTSQAEAELRAAGGRTGRRRTTARSRHRNGAWPRRCGAGRRTVT